MTLDFCNRCASELEQSELVQTGINYASKYSDVFSRIEPYSVGVCRKGFDERYEKTFTRGGKYATLIDFKNMFSIGQNYGKAKLLGFKPPWDAGFCDAIGGYPKGSILRAANGTQMISRIGDNMESIPSDGITTAEWKSIDYSPEFYMYRNLQGQWGDGSGMDTISIPELPTHPMQGVWRQRIGALECQESHLVVFTYLYGAQHLTGPVVPPQKRDPYVYLDLCTQGDMVLKVSEYSDLYTNEAHSDEYIELLHAQTINLYGDEDWPEKYKPTLHLRNPHKVVPFKKGVTYYFYIEYDSGCASDGGGISPLTNRHLRVYRADRQLALPSV